MARYIDADFVANGLREHLPPDDDDHKEVLDQMTYAISILQFAKEADVAPVVHAHWTKDETCSNCGKDALWDDRGGSWLEEYCPMCGAKMDGKDGE